MAMNRNASNRRRDEDENETVGPSRVELFKASAFDPAEESFSQFRSKFGKEGVLVKVYRSTPRGRQYVFNGAPNEIDEEVIRAYHAKQPYASEEGQYTAVCFVNGEARDGFPILIAPQTGAPGLPEAHHGGMAAGGDVLRLLMEQNERLERRLLETERTEREPFSQVADAMVKLQALQPKSEMPLDQLIKAIDLGKQLAGGNGEADWKGLIVETLKEAGPLLRGVLASRAAAPGGVEVASGENALLLQSIAVLKRKCLAGSDPGLYVELILDNRDDPNFQRLIQNVLSREFSEFAALDPEIGKPPFLPFFLAIYDGLRQWATAGNSVAEDTAGESGHAPDTPSNGKSGKGGRKKS